VEEVIAPALDAGRDVVCDRFSGSTLAYQGHGRGLDLAELSRMSDWASGDIQPDRVILIEVDAEVAWSRSAARAEQDRMEAETADFFTRVSAGYAALAAADPARWRVVDGSGTVEEVADRVTRAAAD
jgi:dTMP kinase